MQLKLNLACGEKKRDGWMNVDISEDCKPDHVIDLLMTPWKCNLHSGFKLEDWRKRLKLTDDLATRNLFVGESEWIDKYNAAPNFLGDNTISEIYCSHFIEHIGEELIPFMEECFRVLEPDGKAHFEMPYYTSIRAWQDPTHKRPISEFTFHYFNKEWLKSQGIGHYNIKADFKIEEIRYHYPNGMQGMGEEELKYMREHAWNTVADFEVILKAIK